jgi:hypothetical protein
MAACTISEVNPGQNDAPALASAVRDFVPERYRICLSEKP